MVPQPITHDLPSIKHDFRRRLFCRRSLNLNKRTYFLNIFHIYIQDKLHASKFSQGDLKQDAYPKNIMSHSIETTAPSPPEVVHS